MKAGEVSSPRRMFAKNAIVLNAFHSRSLGTRNGFLMLDPILQPKVRNPQTNHLIHNPRHRIRSPKNIHQIQL
jgi:hypothetical protein